MKYAEAAPCTIPAAGSDDGPRAGSVVSGAGMKPAAGRCRPGPVSGFGPRTRVANPPQDSPNYELCSMDAGLTGLGRGAPLSPGGQPSHHVAHVEPGTGCVSQGFLGVNTFTLHIRGWLEEEGFAGSPEVLKTRRGKESMALPHPPIPSLLCPPKLGPTTSCQRGCGWPVSPSWR